MHSTDVKYFLIKELGFERDKVEKLEIFHDELIKQNKKYNFISSRTEDEVWHRHILDSAQIIKFIQFSDHKSLADLGSGAGFPGLVLAIYNKNSKFHVKLYEKSPVKCDFLRKLAKLIDINVNVVPGNCLTHQINSDYIVCRAFKKLPEILRISREIANKPHKLIILKGKNAQEEIKIASHEMNFEYKLENSITDKESKIILCNVIKSE